MNNKRVFYMDELETNLISAPRGGKGEMMGRTIIPLGDPLAAGSPFIGSGVNSILPGGAIGLHSHIDDEEIYVIISGQGDYLDNEGKRHPVKSGDITFCCKGEQHGLENTGSTPLVFGAAIAK